MKRQEYLDFKKRQEQEFSEFPIAYAFNDKQLEEALAKLGATKEECVTVFNHGDIVKKTDVNALIALLQRHTRELRDKLREDKDFAEAAFLYEMDNHEYAINWSADEDVMDCFSIDWQMLRDWGLEDAYRRARNQHMRHAEEWGMI